MENEQLNKVVHFANISSILIVVVAVIVIILSAFALVFPKYENIEKLKLDYVIKQDSIKFNLNDSTSVYAKINPSQINKLNKNNLLLFKKVDSLVTNYEKRHNDVLSSSKKQNDFISFAATIFAFIVTIAGFFGFKSINEMKKAAIESAEQEARKVSTEQSKITSEMVAKKTASDITDNYIDKFLSKEVQATSRDTANEILSAFDQRLTTLENNKEAEVEDSNIQIAIEEGKVDIKKNDRTEPFNDKQL